MTVHFLLGLGIYSFICGAASGTGITFANDPLSRRIEKRVDGIRTKAWLWSGALRISAELDAANVVTARFIYAGGANVPSHIIKGADTFRFITDLRGSVRLVVNTQTGTVAQRLDYDEFGRVTRDTNPGFQPFGFAGGLYDSDTGFVRFGVRDYHPNTVRWTAKDPVRFHGGDANLYAYAGANPVSATDPGGTRRGVITIGGPTLPPVVQQLVDDLDEQIEIEGAMADRYSGESLHAATRAWRLRQSILAKCPVSFMGDYAEYLLPALKDAGYVDSAELARLRAIEAEYDERRFLARDARQRQDFLRMLRTIIVTMTPQQ